MQVSIYKISEAYRDQIGKSSSSKSIILNIVEEINKKEKENFYNPQESNSNYDFKDFDVLIFYKKHDYTPEWIEFYSNILEDKGLENTSVGLLDAENVNNSVVCFIYNKSSIYAICNGYSANSIARYCDPIFGLDISSKLGCPIESVKSLKENDIIGNVLAATQIFRNDHILLESEGIGKLYKEIDFKMDNEFLYDNMKIGKKISGGGIKKGKSGVKVGIAYKLKKEVSFDDVINLITYLESVKDNNSEYELTNLVRLNARNKKDMNEIEELNQIMLDSIYTFFQSGKGIDIELINNNFEAYNNASEFHIFCTTKNEPERRFSERPVLKDLLELFQKEGKLIEKEDFIDSFKKYSIYSRNEDEELTQGSLVSHLVGEVKKDSGNKNGKMVKKVFFLIDNQWFSMNDKLIGSLNGDVKNLLKKIKVNKKKLAKWRNGIEDEYNVNYVDKPGFYVFHRIVYNNIEIADFIEVEGNKLIFYHVKKGFDSSMRDLVSQINISARIVQSSLLDIDNPACFADVLYDTLEIRKTSKNNYFKIIGGQTDKITKSDFKKLFIGKKIEYCLVVKHNGSVYKPENSNSCIAKFSLIELINAMNDYRIDLNIEEV